MNYEDDQSTWVQKLGVVNLVLSPVITLALIGVAVLVPPLLIVVIAYWWWTARLLEDQI